MILVSKDLIPHTVFKIHDTKKINKIYTMFFRKGTLFRSMQKIGRRKYSVLSSR